MKAFTVLCCAFVLLCLLGGVAHAVDAGAAAPAKPAATPAKPAAQPPASAPSTPATAEDAVDLVGAVIKFFKDGNYRLGVSALITLLVFVWRRFASGFLLKKIPNKHLAWITAAIGVLAAIPAALTTSPWSWGGFIKDALLISGPAVLFWSTLGKLLLPKVFGELPKQE